MHPNTFKSNLVSAELRDEVFVVMSFAAEFNERWEKVIQPAIAEIGFTANRVDYNQSGESIVHDILDGIAHARLVVGDITSVQMSDAAGAVWPQRNGNVMWEIGIAHSMRLPDEVLLIRTDSERSIFDLTQFRAFTYDTTDFDDTKHWLIELMTDRLRAVDQTKSSLVAQAVSSIDSLGIHFLLTVPLDDREFTIKPNMTNGLMTPRLFDLGIICLLYTSPSPRDKRQSRMPSSA